LSRTGFGLPEGHELGATDVGLEELGLQAIAFDGTLSEDDAGPGTCGDEEDNDLDERVDCDDSDCAFSADCM